MALAIAGVVLMLAAGCGGGSGSAGPTGPGHLETIKVAYFKGAPTSAMAVLASEQGLFKKHGLAVKLQSYTAGPAGLALLVSGQVDYLSGIGPPLMAPALAQGACVKYLAADEGNVLDVIGRPGLATPNAGKPYPEPLKDLKGKKLGIVVRGGAGEAWIDLVLKSAGLDPKKDVTLVAVGPPPTALAALKNGRIDATYSAPPMESMLGSRGFKMIAKLAGENGNVLSDAIQAGELSSCRRIQQAPAQVKRYCSAIQDAFAFAKDPSHEATMERFMSQFLGVSPKVGRDIWRSYGGTFRGAGIDRAAWQAQRRYLPPGVELPAYDKAVYGPCAGGPNA
jgi:ABC-type nitrate/sulfonate/bicarbonate transport system substrate-binding protein